MYFRDDELGNECVNNCQMLNQKCDDDCSQADYACMNNCATRLSNCIRDCPCQAMCPDGCQSPFCQSTFCICQSENPEYDEQDLCESAADNDYFNCIIGCSGDNSCMSECTRVYNEQLIDCPCHANCPNGCPCPNYECNGYDENDTTPAPTHHDNHHYQ